MKMKTKIVLNDMHGRHNSIACVSNHSDDSQDGDEWNDVSSSTSSIVPIEIAVVSNKIGKKTKIVKIQKKSDCTNKIKRSRSRKNRHQSIFVQHNYHDHANDPWILDDGEDGSLGPEDSEINHSQHINSRNKKNNNNNEGVGVHALPFPEKLYELLSMAEIDGFNDIVGWQPHGRCFIINKPIEFLRDILPKHFGLKKLASFQRQLNLYGFKRLTKGRDKNGYYHELFLRGRLDLIHSMVRVKIKGTGIRPRANPNQEPDFWELMCWVPDIMERKRSQDNDNAYAPTFNQLTKTECGINIDESMKKSSSNHVKCFPTEISICSSKDHLESSWSSLSAAQAIQMRLDESIGWMAMLTGHLRSSSSHAGSNCQPETNPILRSNIDNNAPVSLAMHDDWVGNFHSLGVKSNDRNILHNNFIANGQQNEKFLSELKVTMPDANNGLSGDQNDEALDYDWYHNNLEDCTTTEDESDAISLLDDTDMVDLFQELEESISPEALENDSSLADLLMRL